MKIREQHLLQIRKRKANSPIVKKQNQVTWFFPKSQERQYTRDLHRLTNKMKSLIKEYLYPAIPEMIAEVGSYTPDRSDDYMDRLRQIINFIRVRIKPLTDETIIAAAQEGVEISKYNESQFQKMNRSVFGIDLYQDEPWLEDQLKLFANQNAQLITGMTSQELERVAGIVERGLQQGERFTQIAEELQKSFGISHRRATLIARDQTSKLNSSLSKLRQQELGIEEYIWQTSGDERVRPTHRANDGKKFRWDKPPSKTGHPGHDVNCRCVAVGVIEGFLDVKMVNE